MEIAKNHVARSFDAFLKILYRVRFKENEEVITL